jgi:hypothetical protein
MVDKALRTEISDLGLVLNTNSNAAFIFMLGVLKDKPLTSDSTSLVSGVSSGPTLISRLPDLEGRCLVGHFASRQFGEDR